MLTGLVLYAACLVIVSTRNGPGITNDSVHYVSAARSFTTTGTFLNYLGDPLTLWPPGLPVILGTAIALGFDVEAFTIMLNAVCAGATVFLTYVLTRRVLDSVALALLAAALVSVSAATVRTFSFLWSEPPVVVLTLLVLVLLTLIPQERESGWWLIPTVGLTVSAATTIRYISVALIPIAMLGIALAVRQRGVRHVALSSALMGGVSSLGLVIVAARNHSLGAAAFGDRAVSGRSLDQLLQSSVSALGSYLAPISWTTATAWLGLIPAALLLCAFWKLAMQRPPGLILVGAFVAVYWLLLWYSQLAGTVDLASQRMLAPTFAPSLILVMYAIREIHVDVLRLGDTSLPRALGTAVILGASALALGVFASAIQGMTFAVDASQNGLARNSAKAMDSAMARALTTLPPDARVATNDPAKVYWITGRRAVRPLPAGDSSSGLASLKRRVQEGDVDYLAIFNSATGAGPVTPDDVLGAGVQVHRVGIYEDGELWAA